MYVCQLPCLVARPGYRAALVPFRPPQYSQVSESILCGIIIYRSWYAMIENVRGGVGVEHIL